MQDPKIVQISGPFMTIGQLLKEEAIIPSGGAAKWFLKDNEVLVNDEVDQRRGRKLYPNDRITVTDVGDFVIQSK
ncbi:S4 domain-containing protein YaaA [Paucilactobacillus suebicus]|uniref:S4 region, YaaA n=1 Tax=Paucilactobacillus suebicus DSM 5007 = KCTC 3549 TaxID=1423807 RepID=A0A0R1W4Q7_9LACO|nr:S4 domain-containing protein YaaA [Paucilactobacillus suebicus]KRM12647.1 S4 region, YaaA [Paucilactobacillus suebicus DSM 5007 = KCTC 3549]